MRAAAGDAFAAGGDGAGGAGGFRGAAAAAGRSAGARRRGVRLHGATAAPGRGALRDSGQHETAGNERGVRAADGGIRAERRRHPFGLSAGEPGMRGAGVSVGAAMVRGDRRGSGRGGLRGAIGRGERAGDLGACHAFRGAGGAGRDAGAAPVGEKRARAHADGQRRALRRGFLDEAAGDSVRGVRCGVCAVDRAEGGRPKPEEPGDFRGGGAGAVRADVPVAVVGGGIRTVLVLGVHVRAPIRRAVVVASGNDQAAGRGDGDSGRQLADLPAGGGGAGGGLRTAAHGPRP